MRSLAPFVSLLTLGCLISLAQTAQHQKAQDKDADKKQAVSAAAAKRDKARNEKKEEPKKEKDEEKKPGVNAETFSGLKFRLIGPAVASGRVMSIAGESQEQVRVLRGRGFGGRLEDGQRRHDMDSAFR
jgi:FKBP-type peptidyl-prolyl cis-trans isomerase